MPESPGKTPIQKRGEKLKHIGEEIEQSINERISELRTIDKGKADLLQKMRSEIVEKLVMPKKDEKTGVLVSRLDDLRLDQPDIVEAYQLLTKNPESAKLLTENGINNAKDFLAFLGITEISSDQFGLQPGPAELKRDTQLYKKNGRAAAIATRGDKVEIISTDEVKINGEACLKVKIIHDRGKYRPTLAGKTKTYTGYLAKSSLQGNRAAAAPAPESAPAEPPQEPASKPEPEAPKPVEPPKPKVEKPDGSKPKDTSMPSLTLTPTPEEAEHIRSVLLNGNELTEKGEKMLQHLNDVDRYKGINDHNQKYIQIRIYRQSLKLPSNLKTKITKDQFITKLKAAGKPQPPEPSKRPEPVIRPPEPAKPKQAPKQEPAEFITKLPTQLQTLLKDDLTSNFDKITGLKDEESITVPKSGRKYIKLNNQIYYNSSPTEKNTFGKIDKFETGMYIIKDNKVIEMKQISTGLIISAYIAKNQSDHPTLVTDKAGNPIKKHKDLYKVLEHFFKLENETFIKQPVPPETRAQGNKLVLPNELTFEMTDGDKLIYNELIGEIEMHITEQGSIILYNPKTKRLLLKNGPSEKWKEVSRTNEKNSETAQQLSEYEQQTLIPQAEAKAKELEAPSDTGTATL